MNNKDAKAQGSGRYGEVQPLLAGKRLVTLFPEQTLPSSLAPLLLRCSTAVLRAGVNCLAFDRAWETREFFPVSEAGVQRSRSVMAESELLRLTEARSGPRLGEAQRYQTGYD